MNTTQKICAGYTDAETSATHFTPNKALGQNFLRATNIAKNITNLVPAQEGMHILEVGAGAGALTRYLQEYMLPLVILEKDPYWAGVHGTNLPTICTDALTFSWEQLHSRHGKCWCIIGNLPYNIASPLLWDIISQSDCFCIFMVQKEVGERLIAKPHTSAYGALSIWLQSFSCIKKEYIVPPSAFFPPPKIDSMVLSFTPLCEEERTSVPKQLKHILSIVFSQRRKQVQGVLKKQFPAIHSILEALGLPPTARAEELSVQQIHQLTSMLYTEQ